MALAAYRNLIRAARIAFQDDAPVLASARQQIRIAFREQARLRPDDLSTRSAIQHAHQVAMFLRANVVQGRRVQGEQGKQDVYRLRIHEHIERGDNDSIKAAGQGTIRGGGCCGGKSK